MLFHQGPVRKLKPVNTRSQKHIVIHSPIMRSIQYRGSRGEHKCMGDHSEPTYMLTIYTHHICRALELHLNLLKLIDCIKQL